MLKNVISLIKRGQTCLITNRHIPKDILYKDTIKSNRRNFLSISSCSIIAPKLFIRIILQQTLPVAKEMKIHNPDKEGDNPLTAMPPNY